MHKNLIYIEEYDIYQYFDGEKSFFSREYPGNTPESENRAAVAVISKNIDFSVIPKNGVKSFKKTALNKYLAKYYRNESYFYIRNAGNEYGVYHTLPLNIKKYYSLSYGIDFIIPYDYLVILFLNEKSIIYGRDESVIFIEKTEDIYKITVISNGFNLFPVASFKEDTLNDNLNILKTKLNSRNIVINKIVANCVGIDFNIFFTDAGIVKTKLNSRNIAINKIVANCVGIDFNIFFTDAGIVNFTAKDFAVFFDGIKNPIPYFENLEIKFKKIELRKNRLINIYIAVLVIAVLFMQSTVLFFNGKSSVENKKIKLLNENIAVLSEQNLKKENIILFNEYFTPVNLAGYLEKFITVFPKKVKIENLDVKRLKNTYIIDGTAYVKGGYRKFAKNYNLILKKFRISGRIRISYNLDNFGKPYIKFYGRLK
jgi:hypothetical protein